MEKISLVVSVYNEEQGLSEFYKVTDGVLRDFTASPEGAAYSYDFWFVNDGSRDRSGEILEALHKETPDTVKVITFSRNFGHEAAMCAGLDYADGDYLIFLDADLQHPPQMVPRIMEKFAAGAEVINMVRTRNETAGAWKNLTSRLYYSLMNRLSEVHLEPNASDFFALRKNAAEVLRKSYRNRVRFLRGYVQNIGFQKETIDYEAAERVAGKSHYNFGKLFRLSVDTLVCFSDFPLKAGIYAGFLSAVLGIALIIYTLLTRKGAPSGYATIVIVLCFMFAMLFFILGIAGRYIQMLVDEMKDRPVYIVKNIEE